MSAPEGKAQGGVLTRAHAIHQGDPPPCVLGGPQADNRVLVGVEDEGKKLRNAGVGVGGPGLQVQLRRREAGEGIAGGCGGAAAGPGGDEDVRRGPGGEASVA